MTTEALDTKELFASIGETISELLELIALADEETMQTVPFKDSWTAAQLASHVTKSIKAIAQALNMEGKPAERNAEQRVPELKAIFLDFTTKFQSPDFILPTKNVYTREVIISNLQQAIEKLKQTSSTANLSEIISLPAFGEITKLELLHFVLYHTQRHLHQLKNILHIAKSLK